MELQVLVVAGFFQPFFVYFLNDNKMKQKHRLFAKFDNVGRTYFTKILCPSINSIFLVKVLHTKLKILDKKIVKIDLR